VPGTLVGEGAQVDDRDLRAVGGQGGLAGERVGVDRLLVAGGVVQPGWLVRRGSAGTDAVVGPELGGQGAGGVVAEQLEAALGQQLVQRV
jgi:hypothetical protein